MAPVADAHMHLFAHGYHPGRAAPGGSDVDRYEALMATHDITAALVVGYEGEGIDPDNNAYLRALALQRLIPGRYRGSRPGGRLRRCGRALRAPRRHRGRGCGGGAVGAESRSTDCSQRAGDVPERAPGPRPDLAAMHQVLYEALRGEE